MLQESLFVVTDYDYKAMSHLESALHIFFVCMWYVHWSFYQQFALMIFFVASFDKQKHLL
jgi:hypothetical protein